MKEYKEIIQEFEKSKEKLRNVDTSDKTSGIYMMYIDNLTLDNLIPLYIGQSVNMYTRRTSHRVNIKKLFALSKDEYNNQIPLNSGKYLYCKLVSTLRNNNKTLEDIKFKVLEYCEKEKLDERENYWINFFKSTIYGFNQFEEIIKSNKLTADILFSKEILDYNKIMRDGKDLLMQFEKKLHNFDTKLLKYKYYSVNYTLLLGNYNQLQTLLDKVSTEHFMEIDEEIDDVLAQAEINIKTYIAMFMQTAYLKFGEDLFKEFEIN